MVILPFKKPEPANVHLNQEDVDTFWEIFSWVKEDSRLVLDKEEAAALLSLFSQDEKFKNVKLYKKIKDFTYGR